MPTWPVCTSGSRVGVGVKRALAAYGRALRQAAQGDTTPIDFLSPAGQTLARMDAAHWCGDTRPGDQALLRPCDGATLDVGCGPGRLLVALAQRSMPALGIDISAEAVVQARSRGATALLCDVFGHVPAEGRWRHVLLADGNIGIGGDPRRLLRRCAMLLRRGGTVIVELGAPGTGSWRRPVRLRHAGHDSPPFWWAAVATSDLPTVAAGAGLRIRHEWNEEGRWFASLSPATT
ncbi:MAG TPA: SAM-dependent methyltransferase [Micromonosporaceae bacterium]|nr:SAM-dependent methyltransferase [Micromonosporaceae bacterium]HCU49946.1 SAM-dependent methyltransferase [Micromonosporaceae bacterium]